VCMCVCQSRLLLSDIHSSSSLVQHTCAEHRHACDLDIAETTWNVDADDDVGGDGGWGRGCAWPTHSLCLVHCATRSCALQWQEWDVPDDPFLFVWHFVSVLCLILSVFLSPFPPVVIVSSWGSRRLPLPHPRRNGLTVSSSCSPSCVGYVAVCSSAAC